MQVVGTHGAPPPPPIPLELLDDELDDELELLDDELADELADELELEAMPLEPPMPPIPLELLDDELDDVPELDVMPLEPPMPPMPLELLADELDDVLELDVMPLEPPMPPVFPDEPLELDVMPLEPPIPPIPPIPPVSPPPVPPVPPAPPAPPEEFVGGDVSSLQPTEKAAMTKASAVQGVRGIKDLSAGTSRVMAVWDFLKRGLCKCYTRGMSNAIGLTWRPARHRRFCPFGVALVGLRSAGRQSCTKRIRLLLLGQGQLRRRVGAHELNMRRQKLGERQK